MNLASVAMPNPIAIAMKEIVAIMGRLSAIAEFGITPKSKGKIENKAKIVTTPNEFKTISVASRNIYLSKITKII